MGKDISDIENMYLELLSQENLPDDGTLTGGERYYTDDDGEEFLTSKEIIKTKEELDDKYGVIPRGDDGTIEEDVHYKRYSKRREHKYTETELNQIRESCVSSIVHDYGENDKYHMSDEERATNDMLDELGMKLDNLKRTYRRVDQYIEAMRVVMQAWEMLEQKGNFIHSRDEFFTLVAQGRIVSNRIIMPKLKKIDMYNMDTIIKYISNPELDPEDLVPEPVENDWYNDIFSDEDAKESMMRLLTPEEAAYIKEHEDDPPEIRVKDISKKLIRGYDRRDFGRRSKRKKGNKVQRYIREGLHDILNMIQNSELNKQREYSRSSFITNSMFELDKKPKDVWDNLYFDGSWANDDDLFLYDLAIREELLRQHPVRQQYMTFADEELARFFKILEDNGINTIDLRRKMDCTESGTSGIEEKAVKKENKKIESALIQRITKLNQSPKFKKIVSKAEEAVNNQFGQY